MLRIDVRLDRVMTERRMSYQELSDRIGLTPAMVSRIKNGKIRGMRFSTLELICDVLDCEPGDILVRIKDED